MVFGVLSCQVIQKEDPLGLQLGEVNTKGLMISEDVIPFVVISASRQ